MHQLKKVIFGLFLLLITSFVLISISLNFYQSETIDNKNYYQDLKSEKLVGFINPNTRRNDGYRFNARYVDSLRLNSNYYYTHNNTFFARRIIAERDDRGLSNISILREGGGGRFYYVPDRSPLPVEFKGYAFYNSRNPFSSNLRYDLPSLTQYISSDSRIRITNLNSYTDYLNLPNSNFNKNYQVVLNLSANLTFQGTPSLSSQSGVKVQIIINPNDLRLNSPSTKSINLLNIDAYDGDNLIINKMYGESDSLGDDWQNFALNNKINTDFYGIPITGFQNSKRDKLNLNIRYSLTLMSNNKLKIVLNPTVTTANDGNQNDYVYRGFDLSFGLDNIEVKPVGWSIIEASTLRSNIDQVFNSAITGEVNNEPNLTRNQTAINNLVNERINQGANILGYYLQGNYNNWFRWSLNNFNDTNKTVDINFMYKPFYTTSSDGWERYTKRVRVNLSSTEQFTTRKFAENVWERLLINNSRLSYNTRTGLTITPQLYLNNNNPWVGLNQQPYPQNGNERVQFPNFGTWIINSNTRLEYHSLPGINEDVIVNGQTLDSLDGNYSFLMFDPATKNKAQTGESNEYTVEIKGNKNGAYSTLFKIKFIIKALYPNTNIAYRNWDPSKYPLDQWQATWIRKPATDDPNPDFMPNINEKSGLAEQIVWVYNKGDKKVTPFDLNQNVYHNLTFPDPVDPDGKLLYDLSAYIDSRTNNLIDPSKLNVTADIINKVGNGFIAKGVISPKGIYQIFGDNSKRIIRNNAFKDLSIDNFDVNVSNNNNRLNYLDKKGIYKYSTFDNTSKLYGSTYVVIGDDVGKNQTFSQYINGLNKGENIVIPFWESVQGSHLASYLREVVKLNLEDIRSLSYEQVQAWWNIYVKNAILKAENPTSKTYDLKEFLISIIKTSFNNVESIKNKVLEEIKKAFDLWSTKLKITNKDDEPIKFIRNEHYTLNGADGASFDNLDWSKLISNNNQINRLHLVLSAVSPNVYLTGNKRITILNSNSYSNIYDLNQINLGLLNENTKDANKLNIDIRNYINRKLSVISKKPINSNDWYIVNDLEKVVNDLVNLTEKKDTKEVELTINATDNSEKLSGYGFLVVNNSLNNRAIAVSDDGEITEEDASTSNTPSGSSSNGNTNSNDQDLSSGILKTPASVAGVIIGSLILLFTGIVLAYVIYNKKKNDRFKSIDVDKSIKTHNDSKVENLTIKKKEENLGKSNEEDSPSQVNKDIEMKFYGENSDDENNDANLSINQQRVFDQKDLEELAGYINQEEQQDQNLPGENVNENTSKNENKALESCQDEEYVNNQIKTVTNDLDESSDSNELEKEKVRLKKMKFEELQVELNDLDEKLLMLQNQIEGAPAFWSVQDRVINDERVQLVNKKEWYLKIRKYLMRLINDYEMEM
ncbi:hypothetical protein [[Mycoplasma] imitans]|uniref:hypothetical protein n=1 Tax=[Mycoplasma] imitans TaxID=29560 RepID=UPI00048A3D40|nr:hypothetical protein [[Mycoplasma] imitans]